jgi:hypothetical protein
MYGFETRDKYGKVVVSSTHFLAKLKYAHYAGLSESGSVELSDMIGRGAVACAMACGTGSPHAVVISGTTVSWTPSAGGYESSVASLIYVFYIK